MDQWTMRWAGMSWRDFAFRLKYWEVHIGSYLMLTLIDDPAWLAFMFC